MSTAPTTTRYTPADLLALPDGDRFELVHGEFVERHLGQRSSRIGGKLLHLLYVFNEAAGLGCIYPADASYQCFPDDPQKVRKPDVSFICKERQAPQDEPEGHSRIHPDLAVEVLSPNDLADEIDEKVADYLGVGVLLVWVVHPRLRMVVVHRHDGTSAVRREQDELSGEAVLPGFRCLVRELFTGPVTGAAAP